MTYITASHDALTLPLTPPTCGAATRAKSRALAGLGLIGAAAIAGTAAVDPAATRAPMPAVLPPPPAMEYRPVAPQDALKINALSRSSVRRARRSRSRFAGASTAAHGRARSNA